MKETILYLLQEDHRFSLHYTDMYAYLSIYGGLSPHQMSILQWRMRVHDMIIADPALFRVCISTRQEQDEIRFMKGWQFRELEKVLSPWQIRQCREIKNECWG